MVLSKHIDHNIGCTGVFRMCLMVIDICIGQTVGFLTVLSILNGHISTLQRGMNPLTSDPCPKNRGLNPMTGIGEQVIAPLTEALPCPATEPSPALHPPIHQGSAPGGGGKAVQPGKNTPLFR